MKVDKSNPLHWWRLLCFGGAVLTAIVLRWLGVPRNRRVIFYGHRLAGNLLPIFEALERRQDLGIEPAFLTMDGNYGESLRREGKLAVRAGSFKSIVWLATSSAVVSDHGLHAMQPMVRLSNLKFFDVWHGIPFKGFDADDFVVQRRYDEVWVASELCRELYVKSFGFNPARVLATGYARTDRLIVGTTAEGDLRDSLGIPHGRRTILFAPTWTQDDSARSIFPFGCSEQEFVGALSEFASDKNATILLRSHLNSHAEVAAKYKNVIALPSSLHPDTEAILLVSDVLVYDWSSIAFDFLLLNRPTVCLDVPAPFRKGFSLGPEYRTGPVVGSLRQMIETLEMCFDDPRAYWQAFGEKHRTIVAEVYGEFADGRSVERCIGRLIVGMGRISC